MRRDQHDLQISGSAQAVSHLDRATDLLLHFREGCLLESDRAVEVDPTFVMGHVLRAYLRLLSTELDDRLEAMRDFNGITSSSDLERALPRERLHVSAITAWLRGDMAGAGRILRGLQRDHPRDVLAMIVGHQIDFFTGDATGLRDRIGEALPSWAEGDRHFGPVLGMYAFGLEECGEYERAEELGREAVELDAGDVWAIHSVAHTCEMQGRFGEGTSYFDEHRAWWTAADNFFSPHNWWHYCLYALEFGDIRQALQIYDAELHNDQVEPVAMRLLDATALLWRLYLEDNDQHQRWRSLADAWAPKVQSPFYAFNDMHAVMAYVGAGEIKQAQELLADRVAWVEREHPSVTNHQMTAEIGIPVCQAIVAFGLSRYRTAVDLLLPIRHRLQRLGGSHAQRDAVQKTLVEAAIRARRLDVAQMLLAERTEMRPSSPYNWLKTAQLRDISDDAKGASAAAARAALLAGTGGARA